MKRPSSKPANPKPSVPPAKRRTVSPKPNIARKAPKPSSPKRPAKAASASRRKPVPVPLAPQARDPAETKQSQVIARLREASGATMAQLTTLTGWQSHTVRGTISGTLRKRLGLDVQCTVEEGVRVYRIAQAAA